MRANVLEAVLAEVREEELVAMCCDVVNIPSPTGEEMKMATYMQSALQGTGLNVTWQEIEEGRANVIARWEGTGDGPVLMFNGHMDTSNTGDEPFLTGLGYKPHALITDGFIWGLGIYNMKGALCCYAQAVKALKRAGIELVGDLIVGAVAGEIEKTQWGEYTGRQYRGYGVGSHYLANHGVLPDMCILGEPTDMKLVLEHSGSIWTRISTKGIYSHTAWMEGREHQNALNRMHEVMNYVLEWAADWRLKTTQSSHKGIVNLGCLRAGEPWRASRTPPSADLFLDIRVPPHVHLNEARRSIKKLVVELRKRYPDYGIEFETYVSVPGATIDEDHPVVKAIQENHARVMGQTPERDTVLWCSDASVLSRYGVPSVNYGPSNGPRDAQGEKVAIETLVQATKIYALIAANICGIRC